MIPQAWAVAYEHVFRPLDFARKPWDSLIDVTLLLSSGLPGTLLAPFDSGK